MRRELQDLRYDNQRLRTEITNLREKMERRENMNPPRMEREDMHSRFFQKPEEREMEVGMCSKDLFTPTPSASQRRKKDRVAYAESDGSGEGEVQGVVRPPPPLAPEPIPPPPFPQRTPKNTKLKDAKKRGGVGDTLTSYTPPAQNTRFDFLKEDQPEKEEQPTANNKTNKDWVKRDKLITELQRLKNKLRKIEEGGTPPQKKSNNGGSNPVVWPNPNSPPDSANEYSWGRSRW